MLPLMTIVPRLSGVSCRRSGFREPGESIQRIAHDIPALASTDFAPLIDSLASVGEIEPAPIADRRPNPNPGIPYIASDHRRRVSLL